MEDTEIRHCSGCGQDKPLQQFQVNETNRGGTTWVRTRKWCHACCNDLFKKQTAFSEIRHHVMQSLAESRENRRQALGPLPPWCDRHIFDYLVNGENAAPGIYGRTRNETRAKHLSLLWQEFQERERATGEPLGARGARFMKAMADLLHEPEDKLRQKIKRMCKHEDQLSAIFETAPSTRASRRQPKLRAV